MTAVALLAADAVLRRIRSGRLELVLPDGSRRSYGATGGREAELEVLDWAFLRRLARSPRVALGEGFQAGEWRTPDLVGLLELLADNYTPIAGEGPLAALSRLRGLVPRPRLRHGLRASEQDVQAHYDLSNEFFALWLDPSLTYSCAVFEEPDQSLEEAQQHKYRLLCDRLGLASHHHLLEIGTGWGGMALHAARERGCRVTTTTISSAQHELASRRVAEAGLTDRVEVLKLDYRRLTGRYDRIVSIEMLEAIGHDQLPTYFRAIDRLLGPHGVAAIQTITIPEQRYRSYRRSEDWLRRHIFPGGLLPSVGEIAPRVRSRDPARRVPARRDRPALRADARPLARAVPRARRRGARARLRRALLPHLGVLSRLLRGGVREPRDPRRAAGARAAARARGTDRRVVRDALGPSPGARRRARG